ncbi:hypothetical protein FB45DRAFT_881033 [Roridomyces roridus]|uniref:Uncharacterized protein n=1 Tax=Roridomyces roridus TaxID=1738132 RepID=A0AAD7AY40_9AGAR|nr:hypothetical protein FB45DRAFT_881033 [Roridomyces roridus]
MFSRGGRRHWSHPEQIRSFRMLRRDKLRKAKNERFTKRTPYTARFNTRSPVSIPKACPITFSIPPRAASAVQLNAGAPVNEENPHSTARPIGSAVVYRHAWVAVPASRDNTSVPSLDCMPGWRCSRVPARLGGSATQSNIGAPGWQRQRMKGPHSTARQVGSAVVYRRARSAPPGSEGQTRRPLASGRTGKQHEEREPRTSVHAEAVGDVRELTVLSEETGPERQRCTGGTYATAQVTKLLLPPKSFIIAPASVQKDTAPVKSAPALFTYPAQPTAVISIKSRLLLYTYFANQSKYLRALGGTSKGDVGRHVTYLWARSRSYSVPLGVSKVCRPHEIPPRSLAPSSASWKIGSARMRHMGYDVRSTPLQRPELVGNLTSDQWQGSTLGAVQVQFYPGFLVKIERPRDRNHRHRTVGYKTKCRRRLKVRLLRSRRGFQYSPGLLQGNAALASADHWRLTSELESLPCGRHASLDKSVRRAQAFRPDSGCRT